MKLQICDRFIWQCMKQTLDLLHTFNPVELSLGCSTNAYWRSKHNLSAPFRPFFIFACFHAHMIAYATFSYKSTEMFRWTCCVISLFVQYINVKLNCKMFCANHKVDRSIVSISIYEDNLRTFSYNYAFIPRWRCALIVTSNTLVTN